MQRKVQFTYFEKSYEHYNENCGGKWGDVVHY